MALLVLYEDIANPEPSDVALDITDRVRVGSLDVTQNAEEGSVAISTVTIDDPDGDLEIVGYRKLVVYETEGEAGVSQLTYNGFIVDRRVIRGPNRTGAGRQWVCSVVDTNCLLEFRIMTGEDSDRPAETDVERMTWLLAEPEMDRVPNHDYFNTSGAVAMDAADYTGQRAVDVINDCAQASGKNYFAFCIDDPSAPPLDDAPGKTIFWYDFADSAEYESTLSLSNVLADVLAAPDTCFEISQDTELTRDPSRVYSGAYVRFDGGDEYEEDFTISNEFTRRDAVVPADNVKTSAKASARALRYLSDMSTEEDRITTSVVLPAAKVNLIREGMRLMFKASHFPERYRAFVPQRVLRRTVKQLTEEFYLLTLTLGWGPSALPFTCAGGIYDITPSQHFDPLGSPPNVHPDGDVYYAPAGTPDGLKHSINTGLGFGVYGGPSGPDIAGDCTASGVYIVVVGPGHIDIQTTTPALPTTPHDNVAWTVFHFEVSPGPTVEDSGEVTTGAMISLDIPGDDSDNCVHVVVLSDGTGACGGGWGWDGADWTAA